MQFREERHKGKATIETIVIQYQELRKNRDAVHEFEVVLTENQIEKETGDGIFIKVGYGVGK